MPITTIVENARYEPFRCAGGLNDPITHSTVISHAAVPLLIVPLKVWQGSACASTD